MPIIDIHTHIGISVQRFIAGSIPYAQSTKELISKMDATGVDCAAVFPFGASLYDDPRYFNRQQESGLEPYPYALENRRLIEEVERLEKSRLLPFVIIDPNRKAEEQLQAIRELEKRTRIWGLKLHTTYAHASPEDLEKSPFLAYAKERDIPIILHSSSRTPAGDPLKMYALARQNPEVQVIVAHAARFSKQFFEQCRQNPLENLFVDVSPFNVLCQYAGQETADGLLALPYDNPSAAFCAFVKQYSAFLVFGSDEPFTSYYLPGDREEVGGSYGEAVNLLKSLPQELQNKIAYQNVIRLLGRDPCR